MHRSIPLLAITLAITRVAAPAVAAPVCDPAEAAATAAALRVHLRDEAARARRWNLGWSVGFAAASAGELGVAAARWNPLGVYDDRVRDTLYVGAGKAAIGAIARIVTPLRVRVPELLTDPCADVIALRGALADAARHERRLFWTAHVGGFVVNLAGVAILADQTSWGVAAVSFAIAYPVGLLSTYTMPRGSWHAWRALERVTIVPVPLAGGGAGVGVAGSF